MLVKLKFELYFAKMVLLIVDFCSLFCLLLFSMCKIWFVYLANFLDELYIWLRNTACCIEQIRVDASICTNTKVLLKSYVSNSYLQISTSFFVSGVGSNSKIVWLHTNFSSYHHLRFLFI